VTIAAVIFWASLAGAVYTYLGYPLLLALVHRWFPRRPVPPWVELPRVSLILAAYNEEAWIERKLANCLALDYPPDKLEVLVGSDGSTDRTEQLAARFADRGVRLCAFSPRRGKMATVNRLVRQATGEICVFTDISELFDPDAVQRLVAPLADPRVGAVTGNHIYHRKRTGLGAGTALYWRFQRYLQRAESRIDSVFACDGTIYACRRDLFPYPPDDTINDDVAVPLGIIARGRRVVFEPAAVARGEVLAQAERFLQQKKRGQAGRYQNFARCPALFRPWPLSRWWIFISHCVMPVVVPWLLVLVLLSNLVLAGSGQPLYVGLLIAQVLFYALAAVGYVAERRDWYLPPVAIPFYFVTANIGSLCGFWAFLWGRQRAAWTRVEP